MPGTDGHAFYLSIPWTDDLRETYLFLRRMEVEIVTPIEDIDSVSTLVIHDPDGNLLMICQKNRA